MWHKRHFAIGILFREPLRDKSEFVPMKLLYLGWKYRMNCARHIANDVAITLTRFNEIQQIELLLIGEARQMISVLVSKDFEMLLKLTNDGWLTEQCTFVKH